jgi:phosphoribosyl-AMP cyclohydrolase / phosphoribosyl-ATP pyrophosphohydrolase
MNADFLAIPAGIAFDERGLVPVIVQDDRSGDVLMLAYVNAEALAATARTRDAYFWSRSRRRLWKKGETSGHVLKVRGIRADCDGDAVLYVVDPVPPTCHTGARTCFGEGTQTAAGVLAEVERVVDERVRNPVAGSYTNRLLDDPGDLALKKLGEEATEVVLAAKGESDERLAEEAADLLYHLVVALRRRKMDLRAPLAVLRRRRRASRS